MENQSSIIFINGKKIRLAELKVIKGMYKHRKEINLTISELASMFEMDRETLRACIDYKKNSKKHSEFTL